jgi:hypothetical protein
MGERIPLAVRFVLLVLMLFVVIIMFDTELRFFYQAF